MYIKLHLGIKKKEIDREQERGEGKREVSEQKTTDATRYK